MIDDWVRGAVLSMIAKESPRATVDWKAVEAEADAAIAYVIEHNVELDEAIHHFLEDTDVRRKSEAYAQYQTENVLKALDG